MKIEGLTAYKGKWESRTDFIVEDFDEFKHLVKQIKNSEAGSQWVLTKTSGSFILYSITYDFRFLHRRNEG